MRADAHYVDQLLAPPLTKREHLLDARSIDAAPLADPETIGQLTESIGKYGVLQPLLVRRIEGRYRVIDGARRLHAALAAGLDQVPCVVHEADEQQAAALAKAANDRPSSSRPQDAATSAWTGSAGAELTRTLASLNVCVQMLSRSVSAFSRDAASTIIEAEVARASGLLQAARTVSGEIPTMRGRVSLRRLLDQVLLSVEAERILNNAQLDADVQGPGDPILTGDESQLALALAGAIRSTMALFDGVAAPRVTIGASMDGTARLAIAVWQSTVSAADAWLTRAFDPSWTDRPGGVVALTAMLALKRIAEAHEGAAEVESTGRGTRITLNLPLLR
jgi:ParB-like chromosome segregation protein Spo0J